MKKNFTRLFVSIILFTLLGVVVAPPASAQSGGGFVTPSVLYRFRVSYFDGGHLLTGFPSEGDANNYTYEPFPNYGGAGEGSVGIYVPQAGYTPAPASGLVALHRWTVIQDGWRTHYYYSTYYTEQPADRYYNGIAGYVFPPGTTQHQFTGVDGNGRANFTVTLTQLSVWYSQDSGFWNGWSAPGGYTTLYEGPPNIPYRREYGYQGIIAALPQGLLAQPVPYSFPTITNADVMFFPPGGGGGGGGGTTGDCNPSSGTVNACHHNGGWWDYDSCSCQY